MRAPCIERIFINKTQSRCKLHFIRWPLINVVVTVRIFSKQWYGIWCVTAILITPLNLADSLKLFELFDQCLWLFIILETFLVFIISLLRRLLGDIYSLNMPLIYVQRQQYWLNKVSYQKPTNDLGNVDVCELIALRH